MKKIIRAQARKEEVMIKKKAVKKTVAKVHGPFTELLNENVIVRGVRMITTGKLIEIHPQELVLVDAARIAETDRYTLFVKTGAGLEVEVYPDDQRVYIGRGSICDLTKLLVALPRSQK